MACGIGFDIDTCFDVDYGFDVSLMLACFCFALVVVNLVFVASGFVLALVLAWLWFVIFNVGVHVGGDLSC